MMYMRNVGIAKNRRQKLGLIRNNALDRNSDVRRIAIVATIVCPIPNSGNQWACEGSYADTENHQGYVVTDEQCCDELSLMPCEEGEYAADDGMVLSIEVDTHFIGRDKGYFHSRKEK